MSVLIINNETKHLDELIKLFGNNNVDVCTAGDDFDEDIYDLYILSGGANHSVFFHPTPYQKELNFVRTTQKKVVGICLGCQIIARAYDALIQQLPDKITGITKIEYNETTYSVFESHKYSVVSLGKDLIGMCTSQYGYEVLNVRFRSVIYTLVVG